MAQYRGDAATVLCLTLLAALVAPRRGQQTTPFLGQGYPPQGGATVYTSVIIDRLIDVAGADYRFEVVLFMLFTWEDPRARHAMIASSAAAAGMNASDFQALMDAPGGLGGADANTPLATNSSYTCRLPCSSLYAFVPGASLCCDGVW